MKVVQFQDVDALALAEIDTPSIKDDEVLVASRSVGICHSDFELLEGRYIIPFDYPIIPGHEWAGEIVEVGRDVTEFKPGDRVVGECVIGEDHFGFSISGAAAEYFVARPEWLHRVPEQLTDTQAALVEPFSCAYFAAMRADNLNASDTAVVFGAGPIGLSCVAVASTLGARVIAAEPNPSRADLARQLGAEEVQIRGSIGSPGVWPQTLRFLARTGLDLSPMVTRRFALDEAPDAYAAARQTGENIKVHIENRSTR